MLDIFVAGQETWWQLLRDPNHLTFEFITGVAQTVVIDVLLLAVVWPRIRAHIHRDVNRGVED